MNKQELHSRLDIIEETLSHTSRFNKFSGMVFMATGILIALWAVSGIYLVSTSVDYPMIIASLKLSTWAFLIIGFAFVLATAIAVIVKSKKAKQEIITPVVKNLLMQVFPYAIVLFIAFSYLLEGPGTNRILYALIITQMLYGLMIWSIRPIVPKEIGKLGVFIFFMSFVYWPLSIIARREGVTIATEANWFLVILGISLGLSHILTGISLRKHGHK